MKVIVTAKPGSGRKAIEWTDGMHCTVWTPVKAQRGAANHEIVSIVAESLGVARSLIEISAGKTGRIKTLIIQKEG